MQLIRASHWTADFQLARACWELYAAEPREGVHVVCLGDPREPLDSPVLEIGAELSRYHPNVHGTPARPVTRANLRAVAESCLDQWEKAFLIAIAAGWGSETGLLRVYDAAGTGAGVQAPDWGRVPPLGALRSGAGGPPAAAEAGEASARGGDNDLGDIDGGASEEWLLYPDVLVELVIAKAGEQGRPVPAAAKEVAKCRDAVIDGILRLYFKMGWDHTRYRPPRGR